VHCVQELYERGGDSLELFPALRGLQGMYLVRGELRAAHGLAEEFLGRAQRSPDPAPLLYAHHALGEVSF
jgi:hypothetical protein